MAKNTKKNEEENLVSLVSSNPDIPRPRLYKLIIKNFRCIGNKPVEIELDDIVVLVGPNNVGKSSILKAYELVMSHGSNKCKLSIEDFPNRIIDEAALPEIELQTIIYDKAPGERWIWVNDDGENVVRERWIWKTVGDPKRQGYDVEKQEWSDNVPWGAPNVANSRRPEPHMVDAFDSPDEQVKEVKKILMEVLTDRIKSLKDDNDDTKENNYSKVLETIKQLQKEIVDESAVEIDKMQDELTEAFSAVFPNYEVKFDAKPEDDLDKTVNFFKADAQLLIGPKEGFFSPVERQGSGARRTLLWTALKFLSETKNKNSKGKGEGRPHVLLLDEPEICLHPNAIRDACNVLYDLPQNSNWQVMVTTHSPAFIDISRDNTTIIRVERDIDGDIYGTTIFRPEKVKLGSDDKERLKLLNVYDPYVGEFFFGGKNIIVEGDTEYTAFKYVISKKPEKYKDIHIIRARGKATIVSLIKVLNQFGSDYSVLHDSDTMKIKTKSGQEKGNPAWGNNINILNEINHKPDNTKVRLLASIPNFEEAYLDGEVEKEKPYNAFIRVQNEPDKLAIIEKLLDALLDHNITPPYGCCEWNNINILERKVSEKVKL